MKSSVRRNSRNTIPGRRPPPRPNPVKRRPTDNPGRRIRKWWRNRKKRKARRPPPPSPQPSTPESPTLDQRVENIKQIVASSPREPLPEIPASVIKAPMVEIPKEQYQEPLPIEALPRESSKVDPPTPKSKGSGIWVSLNRIIDILRRVHRPLWSLTMLGIFLFMFFRGRIGDDTIVELMKWIVGIYVAGRSIEKTTFGLGTLIKGRKGE